MPKCWGCCKTNTKEESCQALTTQQAEWKDDYRQLYSRKCPLRGDLRSEVHWNGHTWRDSWASASAGMLHKNTCMNSHAVWKMRFWEQKAHLASTVPSRKGPIFKINYIRCLNTGQEVMWAMSCAREYIILFVLLVSVMSISSRFTVLNNGIRVADHWISLLEGNLVVHFMQWAGVHITQNN